MIQFAVAVFAVFFGVAVLGKLDNWSEWSMTASHFLPFSWGRTLLAAAFPVIEAIVCVCLIAAPRLGLFAAAALLFVFGAGALVLRSRLTGASCNCFGPSVNTSIGYPLAARNFVLAAVCTLLGTSAAVSRPSAAAVAGSVIAALGLMLVAELQRVLRAADDPPRRGVQT